MNRVPIAFLVLAATSGCMTDPDLVYDDPYMPPRRSQAQAQAQTQTKTQAQAQGWAYTPQNTAVAKKSIYDAPSPAPATVAKSSPPRSADSKSENAIVKASYTETKRASESDTHKSSRKETQPVEAELSPVNLGMLRLTNSKRITFRYELKDAAALGAAGLEIWGTTDMRTWKKYEAKVRTSSSMTVEIKDEGLYGFTMVARGKDDPTPSQPPSSEPPQVWVAVDLTKPVVKLLGAEVKAPPRPTAATPAPSPSLLVPPPSLVVRWNAKDRNLGPRPITLLYAERPQGPWHPLAANLENSGRYDGSLPPISASEMYVRVQAADLMGNLGMAQSTSLQLPSQPSARTATAPKTSAPTARTPRPTVSLLSVDGE